MKLTIVVYTYLRRVGIICGTNVMESDVVYDKVRPAELDDLATRRNSDAERAAQTRNVPGLVTNRRPNTAMTFVVELVKYEP